MQLIFIIILTIIPILYSIPKERGPRSLKTHKSCTLPIENIFIMNDFYVVLLFDYIGLAVKIYIMISLNLAKLEQVLDNE